MVIHKVQGGEWWGVTTVCGEILHRVTHPDEQKTTVWRNVSCDKCKDSSYFRAWEKKNQK